MRFVAGRGAVAKLLQAGDRRHRGLLAGALQRRAIGKMLLAGSAMAKRMAALWQRAIGKSCWQGRLGRVAGRGRRGREWEADTATSSGKASNLPEGMHHREELLAGTLQRRAIGKQARKEPPLQARKEHPVLQANKKESGKAHSLKPALVMTALVRVTGARPRGSSQLLLCSLELLW